MNLIWTDSEKNFVRDNAGRLKDGEIAAALSRLTGRLVTLHAVRRVRHELGIKKRPGRGVCEVSRRETPGAGVGLTVAG